MKTQRIVTMLSKWPIHFRLRLLWLGILGLKPLLGLAAAEPAQNVEPRVAWTSSRVVGSPEPPLPYTTEAAFTNISWKNPLYVAAEPGTESLLVVLQGGEPDRPSRILRLQDVPATDQTETLLEMKGRLIYGLTFHPGYTTNGQLFVFSNGTTGAPERTNRISRFLVARAKPATCDPASEQAILEWHSSGHDGGDLVFGQDGMLYISSGDGTSDSDGWVTGQDLSDLAGGVLRIDVDHPKADRLYEIPEDNPFWKVPGARPELWAYGLRNPWRMTADKRTGQIWVGNNGQDLWESAHLIRRGENYGWSVYEGSHPFYLNRPRGPTPVVAPTIEHSHAEFRSLTGGVVYYGRVYPDLNGVYIYGDYSTGKIWGGRHDGERLVWHRELADTSLQIVGFGVSPRGDLLVVDLGGSLHRLIPNPTDPKRPPFPTRLSDTGLFADVTSYQPHPALVPYAINAPGWMDGAEADRWIALPGETKIHYASSGPWQFPEGTVLMQTLRLTVQLETNLPAVHRRLETRLLTRQQGEWVGYTYRWNQDQTDALLVDKAGSEETFPVPDPRAPNGNWRQTWRYPSRADCLTCHSRAAGFVLGLNALQMKRDSENSDRQDRPFPSLDHFDIFENPPGSKIVEPRHLANPYDEKAPLEDRARAYLHVNCSVCHVEAGGGNSQMDLSFTAKTDRMKIIEARPQHDTFGLPNAMLIAPGDAKRSVLYQRLTRRGPGQMPPLITTVVDDQAARLVQDWIMAMPTKQTDVHEWTMEALEPGLSEPVTEVSQLAGAGIFREIGCLQCHRFHGEGGSVGPDLTGVGRRLRPRELLESILTPSQVIAPEYATTEIELTTDELYVGRVEGEDTKTIRLRLVGSLDEPLIIPKTNVWARRLSPVSNMPSGLVNGLARHQVLDLLRYLMIDKPIVESEGR